MPSRHSPQPANFAAERKRLREQPVQYVDSLVVPTFPVGNTHHSDVRSVFNRLSPEDQRLLREAFKGVGKGLSKKGIFFGAAALFSLVTGKQQYDYGFNSDTDAGDTFCAERQLADQVSNVRGFKQILKLAIVASLYSDKNQGHEELRAPCHLCRQQYSNEIRNGTLPVLMASSKWNDIMITNMENLLPLAYLRGKTFQPEVVRAMRIPTLEIFTKDDLKYRARHGDPIAVSILQVTAAAKSKYPEGVKFKSKFDVRGVPTGVAAAVSKPIIVSGKTISHEELILEAFSPTLGGKSAIRGLMAQLQKSCGIYGKVNVVGIHGHPKDFRGGIPVPSAGARQAVYDRVFFQNTNALFALTMEGSDLVITVDARHLLPMGKPVMEHIDLKKHEDLTSGLLGAEPK